MGVLYSQELADRAQAWLALPLNDKRSLAGLTELGAIWATLNQLPPVTCRQCQYSERSAAVAAYLRDFSRFSPLAIMSDTPANYQLAPEYAGQTLTHESYNKAVTADTLTDEDAEFFIDNGFAHAFVKADGKPVKKAAKPAAPANPELAAEQQAHSQTTEALASEKAAHEETKTQLSEVQQQLVESQKELAKANGKLTKLTKKTQEAADAADDTATE